MKLLFIRWKLEFGREKPGICLSIVCEHSENVSPLLCVHSIIVTVCVFRLQISSPTIVYVSIEAIC